MYLSCLGCRSESEMAGESVVKVLNLEASLTDLQSSLKVAKKKFKEIIKFILILH